jgi:hypothetical protein
MMNGKYAASQTWVYAYGIASSEYMQDVLLAIVGY